MPATVKTREQIDAAVSEQALKREIELRIKAGAIRCAIENAANGRVLVTEWNVIGEQ